ncbi:MAG TPA: tetratricopeptide repeat protein [Thermoanaerobaculia bacterium]|jgi:tetratricopeptide (TPR) repeat protein|nr:tetratricopeptide repeat protein [Thermoanaerobaculia bacterium]
MRVRLRGSRKGFERAAQLLSDGTLAKELGVDVGEIAWESPTLTSSEELAAAARHDSDHVGAKHLDTIASDIASIKTLILESTRSATAGSENTWQNLLDDAREQLRAGDAHTAMQLVLRVRKETASSDDAALHFRVATNLGCAAVALDDYDTALTEFKAAAAIDASAKARANVAIALFAKGLYAEALTEAQEARRTDPEFKPAIAAVIKSLSALGRFAQIDSLIAQDPSASSDDDVLLALAEARFREGSYRAGEHHARLLLAKRADDPYVHLLLVECIVGGINDDPARLIDGLDDLAQKRLLEAESLATTARDRFVATHQDRLLLVALNNLGAIHALRGDYAAAVASANQVLLRDPANEIALQNRGLAQYQLGDLARAAADFEALSDTEYAEAVSLPLADTLLKRGEPSRAATLLQTLWSTRTVDPQALQAAELLLQAYTESDDPDSYSTVLRELEETFGTDPFAQGILALAAYRQGDTITAIRRFERALAGATPEQQAALGPRLAGLYIDQKRFLDAAELYERIGLSTDPRFFPKYLMSMVNAQRYAQAYEMAQDAISHGSTDPVVFDVAARMAVHNGDLASARESYVRALELPCSPRTLLFTLQLAQIEAQLGKPDSAKDLVDPLTLDASDEADDLLMIARLRTLLGLSGALPFAYRAREIAFHDPDVHLAYVRLFLARSEHDKEILDATEVVIGTTVLVTINDEPRTFRIVATATDVTHPGDVSSESALGRQLLGLRAGNEIVLRDTPIERSVAKVTEVMTQYVAAFRETLDQFSTWFPDNLALQKGGADDESLRRLAEALNSRGKSVGVLFERYQQGELSLHGFADLTGERLTNVWWKIISTTGLAIVADIGDRARLEIEYGALEGATTCVVETTALLTLSYLGLLGPLTERFATVGVLQRTIDNLLEDLAHERTLPGRLAAADSSAFGLIRQLEVMEKAVAFAQNKAITVAPKALLKLSSEELDDKARLLGYGGFPSILAAEELSALILSDDAVFRDVARTTWHVVGTSSQTLLRHLTERAVISTHEYRNALVHLATAGYRFLSVKPDDLYWVLDRNSMRYSDEVQTFFRNLEGPHCTEDSAIAVLADLVRLIALEPVASRSSDAALDIVIRTLIAGRSSKRVIERFKGAITRRLLLLPLALQRALTTINGWETEGPIL